ncbi:hypothetical protein ACW7G0_13210 [Lysobacter sp. A286]
MPARDPRPGRAVRLVACALAVAAISGCSGNLPAFDLPNAQRQNDTGHADAVASATKTVALPVPALTTAAINPAEDALAGFLADRQVEQVPAYREALVDLDGDGADDLMMLLEGSRWCSGQGCSLLIFHAAPEGNFRLVTRTTNTRPPIAISSRRHRGWHDLFVGVGTDPDRVGTVALQFNGDGYPADPSLSALLATQSPSSARIVIE